VPGAALTVPLQTQLISAGVAAEPPVPSPSSALTAAFQLHDYDLDATLTSGQAFRWRPEGRGWVGIVGPRWVRLEPVEEGIAATVVGPMEDWQWLADYLQIDLDFEKVLASLPHDAPIRAAVNACRGLRLLRQDPWECLASFILSSTKQIVQIQQVVARVCECFGQPVKVPPGQAPAFAFPSAAQLAQVSESGLRACKMGFRAPYLLESARKIAGGELDLSALRHMPLTAARAELLKLPGVGRKIADCVLLFAYGFPTAFPVDVWVMKTLRELYFRGRRVKLDRLQRFAETYFGPNAGYAQQYLFHHARTKPGSPNEPAGALPGQ